MIPLRHMAYKTLLLPKTWALHRSVYMRNNMTHSFWVICFYAKRKGILVCLMSNYSKVKVMRRRGNKDAFIFRSFHQEHPLLEWQAKMIQTLRFKSRGLREVSQRQYKSVLSAERQSRETLTGFTLVCFVWTEQGRRPTRTLSRLWMIALPTFFLAIFAIYCHKHSNWLLRRHISPFFIFYFYLQCLSCQLGKHISRNWWSPCSFSNHNFKSYHPKCSTRNRHWTIPGQYMLGTKKFEK